MTNSDDRSERLRQRRRQSKEKAQPSEQSNTSNTSEPTKPSKTSESGGDGETSESSKQSVKSELQGTYMYLTEDLVERMDKEFKRLDFELDDHLEHDLEKNRDFYNLVVGVGLDELRDQDPETLAERVRDRRK